MYAAETAEASSVVPTGRAAAPTKTSYWSLERCKRAYTDYLDNKTDEINEQKDSRRYYHGAQLTDKQYRILEKRRQPPQIRNKINTRIDGTIGVIERLRQDPKAFPRTPKQEQGAELATAILRYALDEQEWKAISPEVARDGAIDGVGGIAIEIEQGDQGDKDVGFDLVEPDSFFYDPRSYRPDFSDAGYMGEGRWFDEDTAIDLFPDKEEYLRGTGTDGSELSSNPDRDRKWYSFESGKRLIRIVEVWYKHRGEWCWAIFTGTMILMEGKSYLIDEKGKTFCKYIMFSCNVDHDGDRYGFVRNMKSGQDSYNFKHSKLNHILATKRLFLTQGAVDDVERTRIEAARPDGVVVINGNDVNVGLKIDDQTFDFAGLAKMLEEDKQELDSYGPNDALIGDQTNQSGRAIQLLQQAGMAKLGPYILGYRGWKLRVYRALFNTIVRTWTAPRYIRVTDDEGLANFIQVNGVGIDPQTGYPTMVNALGSLDVDIILDEGPDTVNAQADVYETLTQVLPAVAQMLTPPQAQAAVKVLLETSALPASAKKEFREASQPRPPDPMQQRAAAAEVAGAEAKVKETESKAVLNIAAAREKGMSDAAEAPQQDGEELPMEVQIAQAISEIMERNASARQKDAAARKTDVEANLAPAKAAHEAALARASLAQNAQDKAEDRKIAARQAQNRTAPR
jgi:hypothetical protein